jgi:hypothetical protein
MNNKTIITLALVTSTLAFAPLIALGDQTGGEKAAAEGNNAKRTVKKKWHHMQEATCSKGDAECAAKKVGHRGSEAGEYMGDKAKEGADKVDTNEKVNR